MPKILNLAQQLKEQTSQESEIIQSLTKQQLENFRHELNAIYQQELNTIKADIKRQKDSLSWYMISSRLMWPFIIGVTLFMGIFGGSWGMMAYTTSKTMENYAVISNLNKKIEKLNPYNVKAFTIKKEYYLVLPKGTKIRNTYTSDKKEPVIVWK